MKKYKEEDSSALDERRKRLHQVETERLGLTDACNYETRVLTDEEEIATLSSGSQGASSNWHAHTNGNRSNPISFDEPGLSVHGNQPAVVQTDDHSHPQDSSNNSEQSKQIPPFSIFYRNGKRKNAKRRTSDAKNKGCSTSD